MGALSLENGIALFELADVHRLPPLVQAAVSLVFLLSLLLMGVFLRRLTLVEQNSMPPAAPS